MDDSLFRFKSLKGEYKDRKGDHDIEKVNMT